MSYFDLDTAVKALGDGSDPIDALSMSFGIPQCLLDIGKSAALALLPTSLILSIADQSQRGKDAATEDIAKLKKKLLTENGIFEIDTESGTYRFLSDFSKNGMSEDSIGLIGKLGGLTSSLSYALTTGGQLYNNYLEAASIVNSIGDCINTYQNFLKYQKGPSSQLAKVLDPEGLLDSFGLEMARAQVAVEFINDVDEILGNCASIVNRRLNDPSLEPSFVNAELVSGLGFQTGNALGSAQDPVFRLVFGPPKSKKGQFLLSVDGLYYDSQSGGLPEVSGFTSPEYAYKFEQAANLGGKGQSISLKTINKYVDTIFDINVVDNSPEMLTHYEADHFMSVLEGQRNKNIYDVSSQVEQAKLLGYSDTDAIIVNLTQSIYSINARHLSKITRRKKQIEIAIKAPFIFGKGTQFGLGQVPINDFSFLKDINMAVAYETQKKLIFLQGEVSGVVLPIVPKFVKSNTSERNVSLDHLIVPPVGKGSIIFDSDSIDEDVTILSLSDSVVTDGLFAIYNYLEGEIVSPGSSEYKILNCNSTNNYNNAQLIGLSPSAIFNRGLAIPFLKGAVRINTDGTISSLGSFIKLPDSQEFQNFTYNPAGFSFETWALAPDIGIAAHGPSDPDTGYGTYSYYKLLLACENTGGIDEELPNANQAPYSNNSDIVKGLVIGFTRDRQITQNTVPSETGTLNLLASGAFFIAPTRSVNGSDVGFINKASLTNCVSGYEVLKCSVPLANTIVDNKIGFDVSGEFMYFSVIGDVPNNQVRIYMDGELMATSSLTDVFGGNPYQTPNIPTFAKSNSFEYSLSSTNSSYFLNGPRLNNYFTPWIIGSGWTDGNVTNGGFMNTFSGKNSGLNGYVGSTKFYNRALTSSEVKFNYDSQKGFFKNIDLT